MGWAVFPPCYLTWGQSMVEVVKIMVHPSKGTMQVLLYSVPQSCSRILPTHTSTRDSWKFTGNSRPVPCGVSAPFFLGPGVHKLLFVPPRVCFPVLCEFWGLYGGFNGDLLQEGLCHTQVYCTQSPCPSTADLYLLKRHSNTVLSQSLWGLWVLVNTRYFEPSECLWQVWGLILKVIPPPTIFLGLPLCPWAWGISSILF